MSDIHNHINGIDLEALGAMAQAIVDNPAEGAAGFRVHTIWQGGTRSQSLVKGYSLGGESIDRPFVIDADEPFELLGRNTAPNPQELLMAAVNACMMVGYVANAALRGITLRSVEIDMHGMLDLRGFLGLSDDVPPGYTDIDYTVHMVGDGDATQFGEIHEAVMRTSPNFFNLAKPVRMNGRLAIE